MKSTTYRDHVITAHAVAVGAGSAIRYRYTGEYRRQTEGAPTPMQSFRSNDPDMYESIGGAQAAGLDAGKALVDKLLDHDKPSE
ncbi:hypothetical protein [Cupriavidus plantarum]|uniref:Uncharacterized protein n=1 Tax=Cupriavidus plantarum TaxID=942865 RepID=A0A316F112_9BURK|nr:hypothetical protein [Cupriavidus plantarum]PWK37173.1 hypothetical protein C7419_1011055 [Cupriavidus plantarum]